MALVISVLDVILSALFTVLVLIQWWRRRKPHQVFWSFALLVWTVAVSAEAAATVQGIWTPLTYRTYYLFGALMVAPWLGAGSLFLLASRRLSTGFMIFVAALSVVGGILVFTYAVDPAKLTSTDTLGFVEVKVFPLIPVRLLIIIGNTLGTLAFVGTALYSVWGLWKRGLPRELTGGVLLIGLGGLVAAASHSIGALGGPSLFRVSELAAIVLIFGGYVISTYLVGRPARSERAVPSA